MLVHELVERQVATNPDAVAVVDGTGTLSYAALDARAAHWAARLRAFGAGPEALVGVHLERSAELLAVLLGVLKAGAGYLPLIRGTRASGWSCWSTTCRYGCWSPTRPDCG